MVAVSQPAEQVAALDLRAHLDDGVDRQVGGAPPSVVADHDHGAPRHLVGEHHGARSQRWHRLTGVDGEVDPAVPGGVRARRCLERADDLRRTGQIGGGTWGEGELTHENRGEDSEGADEAPGREHAARLLADRSRTTGSDGGCGRGRDFPRPGGAA